MNMIRNFYTAASVVITSGALLFSCSGEQDEAAQKTESPIAVTVALAGSEPGNVITASGQIESGQAAIISTRVMGFITGITVKPGEQVKKGQLLVTISNDDIQARKAQAHAMLTEAEAALADARKDYERYTALYKQQSASEKELENATLHYQAIKAKAEAAREVQNEVNAMLAYTNLTAPFAGVVVQKNADVGTMANPGIPILMVEHQGSFQVRASVSEIDITRIREGAKADVTIKSSGKKLSGTVVEVSPSSQFSGGQYGIKINIPDSQKEGLHSGMYVQASIEGSGVGTSGRGTLVPVSAIVHRDQLTGIYTVSESQNALLRWVRLGKSYGNQVEVLSGLRSDEKFILAAEGKLYNGVPVKIQ